MYKVYVHDMGSEIGQHASLACARHQACAHAMAHDTNTLIVCGHVLVEAWNAFESRVLYFREDPQPARYTVRVMGDPHIHGPYTTSDHARNAAYALGHVLGKGVLLYEDGKLLMRYGARQCVRAVMLGEAR